MRQKIRIAALAGGPLVAILIAVVAITAGWFEDTGPGSPGDGLGSSNVQQTDGAADTDGVAVSNVPGDAGAPSAQQQAPASGTLDETFAAIEQQLAPGFGGLFFDDAGEPTIYVQDPAQADKTEQVVRDTLGNEIGDADINVRVGQYDYGQLNTWFDAMDSLFDNPALVSTDIDESKNVLTVGVEDMAAEAEVRAELDTLGVPQEAVIVEQEGRPVPLADPDAGNLLNPVLPLAGGLKIADPSGGTCTMGFIAKKTKEGLGTVTGFITNSHCTDKMFGPEKGCLCGTTFHQPNPENPVGIEHFDPPLEDCGKPTMCRYSDSAFVELLDPGDAHMGHIKRPEFLNVGNLSSPLIKDAPPANINESTFQDDFVTGDFIIVESSDYALMGQLLNKVGERTGWTQGTVNRTCFKARQTSIDGNDTAYKLLCQYGVNDPNGLAFNPAQPAFTGQGDSGSPVFQILKPIPPDTPDGRKVEVPVRLKGVLWGGYYTKKPTIDKPGGTVGNGFIFSPLGGINKDLAPDDPLAVEIEEAIVYENITPKPDPTATAAKPNPCDPQPTNQVGGEILVDVAGFAPDGNGYSDVCFVITGTGGGLGKPVFLKDNPPGCPNPPKIVSAENKIHVDWGTKCVKPGDRVLVVATTDTLVNPTGTAHWSNGGVIVANTQAVVVQQGRPICVQNDNTKEWKCNKVAGGNKVGQTVDLLPSAANGGGACTGVIDNVDDENNAHITVNSPGCPGYPLGTEIPLVPINKIVGGIVVDQDLGALTLQTDSSSGSAVWLLTGGLAIAAVGAMALGGGAWYVRRRRMR